MRALALISILLIGVLGLLPSIAHAHGSLATGEVHTCVLIDSKVKCFGDGFDGRLGTGSEASIGDTPGSISGLNDLDVEDVESVSTSDFATCFILAGNWLRCVGYGGEGLLGQGDALSTTTKTVGQVPNILWEGARQSVSSITMGGRHMCAMLDDEMKCWGRGADEAVGMSTLGNTGDDPNEIQVKTYSMSFASAIDPGTMGAAGDKHTCFLFKNRRIRCWGTGLLGRLGSDDEVSIGGVTPTATAATDFLDFNPLQEGLALQVSSGQHTCALFVNWKIRCWGPNEYGELGMNSNVASIGDQAGDMTTLAFVDFGTRKVSYVNVGYRSTCVIFDDKKIRCFGENTHGQLGQGHTNHIGDDANEVSNTPDIVFDVPTRPVLQVSVGRHHACASFGPAATSSLFAPRYKCWGYGLFGQLGTENTNNIGDDPGEMAALADIALPGANMNMFRVFPGQMRPLGGQLLTLRGPMHWVWPGSVFPFSYSGNIGRINFQAGTGGTVYSCNAQLIDAETVTCPLPSVPDPGVNVGLRYHLSLSLDGGLTFKDIHTSIEVQAIEWNNQLMPSGGPIAGGTKLQLGLNMKADPRDTLTCTYVDNAAASIEVRAELNADRESVTCHGSTPFQSSATDKFFQAKLGFTYSTIPGMTFIYHDLGVTSVTPTFGPASGGDLLRISIANWKDTLSQIVVRFEKNGHSIYANGTYNGGSGEIECSTPDVRQFSADKFLLPASMDVSVSLDGGQAYTASSAAFQFHTPLLIEDIQPRSKPIGTAPSPLTIMGLNFLDTGVTTTLAKVRVGSQVATPSASLVANGTYTIMSPAFTDGGVGTIEVTVNGLRYTQSEFQFSYYELLDFFPTGGHVNGGTPVTIVGRGFFGNDIVCNFGSYNGTQSDVSAIVLSETQILCPTPPLLHDFNSTNFTVPLTVSVYNGSFVGNNIDYMYYRHPIVTSIFPLSGPPVNSTTITLSGSGLISLVGNTNATCQTGQATVPLILDPNDQTQGTCDLPESVGVTDVSVSLNQAEYITTGIKFSYYTLYVMQPDSSPTGGGTEVLISGANFPQSTSMVCRFNKTMVGATYISSAQVRCVSPAEQFPGNVTVGFSIDGNIFSETLPKFLYYSTPTVTAVNPPTGSGAGGTPVVISGQNFLDIGTQIKCKFGLASSNGELIGSDIHCPCTPGLGEVDVEVSLNDGQSWTANNVKFFFASVLSLKPSYGDLVGGTLVTVTGSGFLAKYAHQTHCAFGTSTMIKATRVDDRNVICMSPSRAGEDLVFIDVHTNGIDFQKTQVVFKYYKTPKIENYAPAHGPSTGGTMAVVVGTDFPNTNDLACKFGTALATKVERFGSLRINCEAPPNSPGPVPFSVSFNGVDFISMDKDPAKSMFTYFQAFSLNPPRGPAEGGTTVEVSVSGFKGANAWEVQCLIGKVPIIGEYVSDRLIRCITPPGASVGVFEETNGTSLALAQTVGDAQPADLEESIDVRVTANGIQWTGETKFHYYPEPVIEGFYPDNGTSAGGVPVTIFGKHFVPASTLSCKFGEPYDFPVVKGTYISPSEVVCTTTPHEPAAVRPYISNNRQQFHQSSKLVNFTFTACPPGTSAPSFSDTCKPCDVGTANSKLGAIECTKCDTESYMPDEGAVVCIPCPANTFIPDLIRTSITQCTCKEGFYHPDQATGQACEPCPGGGECEGLKALPEPALGFWNQESNRLVFIECASEFACPGGVTESCGVGYAGRLCGMCEKGYYKAGLLCPECPGHPRFIIYAFFIFMALFSGTILFFTGKRATVVMSNITIIAYYCQILGILAKLRMNWPWQIALAMKIISAPFRFDMDLLATECSLPISRKWAYQLKWIALMCIPFLVPIFYGIYYAAAKVRYRIVGEVKPEGVLRDTDWQSPLEKVESFSRGLLGAYIFFLSLTYLILVQASMELFDCTRSADGGFTLDAQPDLQCYKTWWWAIIPAAITALVLYGLCLPLGIIYLGWRGRYHLNHPIIVELSSAVTVEFKHTHYFWKSFLLIEQFLCAASLTFFTVHRQMQLLSFLLILLVSLAFHMRERPYFVERYNTYQTICRWCAICVLLGGLLYLDNSFPVPGSRTMCLIFVIGAIAIGLVASVYYLISDIVLHTQASLHLEVSTPELIKKLCHPQGRSVITRFLAWGRQVDLEPDPFNYMFQALAYEYNDKRRPDRETLELQPDTSSVHAMVYAFSASIFWEPVVPAVQAWILGKIRRARRGDPVAVADIDRFHALFTQLSRFEKYGFYDPEKEKLAEQAEAARQAKLRRRRKAKEAHKAIYGVEADEADIALAEAAQDMMSKPQDSETAGLLAGVDELDIPDDVSDVPQVPEGVEPEGVEPDISSGDEEGVEPDVIQAGAATHEVHSEDSDEEPYWESILAAMNPWYVKKPKVEAIGYAKAVARDQFLDENGEPLLVKLLPVKRKSAEYQDIKNWIATTIVSHNDKPLGKFDLIKIESVVNESLWSQYSLTRRNVNLTLRAAKLKAQKIDCNQDLMLSSIINEYYLWHGCNEALIEKITTFGFEPNLSSMKGMFGAGTYFSEHFSKSDLYTHAANCGQVGAVYGKKTNECTCQYDEHPEYKMLLCRVTLGDAYHTNEMMQGIRIPPEKPGSIQHYDSVFALNSDKNLAADYTLRYSEYITFEKSKAYPAYVITYRRHLDPGDLEDAEL